MKVKKALGVGDNKCFALLENNSVALFEKGGKLLWSSMIFLNPTIRKALNTLIIESTNNSPFVLNTETLRGDFAPMCVGEHIAPYSKLVVGDYSVFDTSTHKANTIIKSDGEVGLSKESVAIQRDGLLEILFPKDGILSSRTFEGASLEAWGPDMFVFDDGEKEVFYCPSSNMIVYENDTSATYITFNGFFVLHDDSHNIDVAFDSHGVFYRGADFKDREFSFQGKTFKNPELFFGLSGPYLSMSGTDGDAHFYLSAEQIRNLGGSDQQEIEGDVSFAIKTEHGWDTNFGSYQGDATKITMGEGFMVAHSPNGVDRVLTPELKEIDLHYSPKEGFASVKRLEDGSFLVEPHFWGGDAILVTPDGKYQGIEKCVWDIEYSAKETEPEVVYVGGVAIDRSGNILGQKLERKKDHEEIGVG